MRPMIRTYRNLLECPRAGEKFPKSLWVAQRLAEAEAHHDGFQLQMTLLETLLVRYRIRINNNYLSRLQLVHGKVVYFQESENILGVFTADTQESVSYWYLFKRLEIFFFMSKTNSLQFNGVAYFKTFWWLFHDRKIIVQTMSLEGAIHV